MEEEEDEGEINKYAFKQNVVLDMTLPSGEREATMNYQMQFLDRNPKVKCLDDSSIISDGEERIIPTNLTEASSDYECTLPEVIGFLKKCGYPLENCFISYFSPVFSAYINCGLDPLPNSIKITKEDLEAIHNGEEMVYKLLLKF